jgi:F-type H+-transporting ATPase subunit O
LKLYLKINPQIIGGIVIEFGEKTIDMSVSTKITKLNSLLSVAI